jgi:ribosomal protein S18 acetylase RimI-like enzyme
MATRPGKSLPRQLADGVEIRDARPREVEGLLPLMRAYCDFYEASPPDQGLLEMARTLIADPEEGAMFVARDGKEVVGFATLDWKWSSLKAAKIGYLEDIFVTPTARGRGIADALIDACAERCRERGAPAMQWQTAPDNHRAQAVYDRTGAVADTYLEYDLGL